VYRAAVVQLLKEKCAALPMPEATPVASHENVVNLMEALKRSLAAEGARTPKAASKTKNPKKAAAGQREMLLPIAGKGTGREKAKNRARPATRQRKAGKILRIAICPSRTGRKRLHRS
jgi:DNA end-binding protein Ku